MQIWSEGGGFLRTHTSTRGNCHGSHQTIQYCRMANPHQSKRCQIIPRVCQLLLKIHWQLLQHSLPTYQLDQEKPGVEVDPLLSKVFHQLKEEFSKQPVLSLPNLTKPFTIATDASGGILLQADSNEEWHPCSYLSQSFSPAERNYDIYENSLQSSED